MMADDSYEAMQWRISQADLRPMTDKIDTSTLGRIDLASGQSPAPIEECVSTWAVDDLVEVPSIVSPFAQQLQRIEDKLEQVLAALSHKDMSRG